MLLAHMVSGGRFYYSIKKGDSLAALGSRYGVDSGVLAQANGLRAGARLKAGAGLWIDNRHIVPAEIDDGILINVPQRMLFVLSRGHLTAAYPVAIGRPGWRTPRGEFTVVEMRKNPVWRVPPSIQAEMAPGASASGPGFRPVPTTPWASSGSG
jgi:L,D-transpeptidase ErfK/SrfK